MGGEMLLSESKNTRDRRDLQYFYRQQLQQCARWLGPQGKEVQQITEQAKNFLLELSLVGEETWRKVTPPDASRRIRTLCREGTNQRLFDKEEWLTAQQIHLQAIFLDWRP